MEKQFAKIEFPATPEGSRIRLLLTDDRGARWSVTMSPGMERFIGYYPRLDAFTDDTPLLRYQIA